ncbi:endonuclease/exonuclease/phosphatase family protein [Nocardioides sp. SOB77]|uniref:Endonuclease/exonuclease/phosphatase family protein n=1 Tax=Nocardioides oceani TaxID=3058369 RepID=A0ABT8F9P6_9ACTN|nr:endonuclease/exonuclease/phosphatase family protein [Nocardioides oceani]MDN4171366.1 endonuclease/exonuclease/phosphatase family protein [Nocardioides oceani]
MRRRPAPLVTLAVAVLLTGLAVVAGLGLAPREVRVPIAVGAPAEVAGARVTARAEQASRSATRPPAASRARVEAASALAPPPAPPYRLHRAGAPLERASRTPAAGRAVAAGAATGEAFTFQVGTLNVQGSQHRPNGTGRAAMHASTVLGRGVDLVGFQEVQDDQLAVLRARLPGWTIWPGQGLGNQGVRLQIGWRDDLFELADTGSIITTFDHQQRPIPYVLLRERATGGEFWVIDLHNSPRDQEVDRDSATGAQIALVQRLQATGRPVLLMGDTNEKTEFGCRVAAATGMVGSNGATPTSCVGAGPVKIDKIMGVGGVTFSGHVVDYGAPVRAATDHAFVHATVTISPSVVPGG